MYFSGWKSRLSCRGERAWYPRSHRYCKWRGPKASPGHAHIPPAGHVFWREDHKSKVDRKPDKQSTKDEDRHICPNEWKSGPVMRNDAGLDSPFCFDTCHRLSRPSCAEGLSDPIPPPSKDHLFSKWDAIQATIAGKSWSRPMTTYLDDAASREIGRKNNSSCQMSSIENHKRERRKIAVR